MLGVDDEFSLLVVLVPVERDLLHILLLGCGLSTLSRGLSQRTSPGSLLSTLLLSLLLLCNLCLCPSLEEESRVGVIRETLVPGMHGLKERVKCRSGNAIVVVLPKQCLGHVSLTDVLLVASLDDLGRLFTHGECRIGEHELRCAIGSKQVLLHLGQVLLDGIHA